MDGFWDFSAIGVSLLELLPIKLLMFLFTHSESLPPVNEDWGPPVRISFGALNFGFLGRPPQQLEMMVNTTSPCTVATMQVAIHVKFCREWVRRLELMKLGG